MKYVENLWCTHISTYGLIKNTEGSAFEHICYITRGGDARKPITLPYPVLVFVISPLISYFFRCVAGVVVGVVLLVCCCCCERLMMEPKPYDSIH